MKILKQTPTNTFLVDTDVDVKEGDFYYLKSVSTKDMVLKALEEKVSSNCHKIIAQLNPELKDIPLFQVDRQEVDEALKLAGKINPNLDEYSKGRWYGFIEGYNTCQELNKEKEDRFRNFLRSHHLTKVWEFYQPQSPDSLGDKEVEIEMEQVLVTRGNADCFNEYKYEPLLTTGGKIQVKLK